MTDKASIIAGMKPMRSNIPLLIQQLKSRFRIKDAQDQRIMNYAVEELQLLKEENEKLEKQGLRLIKRLEEYDYEFDWTVEHRKLNDENMALKEENEKFLILNRIIGENWGEMFKEAFEMVGAKEELIECGIVTEEDFE